MRLNKSMLANTIECAMDNATVPPEGLLLSFVPPLDELYNEHGVALSIVESKGKLFLSIGFEGAAEGFEIKSNGTAAVEAAEQIAAICEEHEIEAVPDGELSFYAK